MGVQFKSPLGKFRVPFFIMDLGNYELITLPNVPLEVSSSKAVKWNNTQVPGLSYEPAQFGNMEAQRISFSIKVANRNPIWGNVPILKQFEKLRTPVEGLASLIFGNVSNANPEVLFWYGTGNTIPLIYRVLKCDFSHVAFNSLGYPTVTDISIDLMLKEDNVLYECEKVARMVLSVLGMADSIYSLVQSFKGEKPY